MKLYELTGKYAELQAQMEAGDWEAVSDTLESLEGAIEEKVESIYRIRQNLRAEINGFKEEEKRLKERRQRLESELDHLEGYVEGQLMAEGIDKVKTGIGTVGFRKAPASVEIVDEEAFLSDDATRAFVKTEYKINKRELLKFVKETDAKEGPGFRVIDDKRTLQFR